MANPRKKINVEEVMSSVSSNLEELRHLLESGSFTEEEWDTLTCGLENLELKAYQVKLAPHLQSLVETNPDIPARDAIIQLLAHIRPHASPSMVAQVTKYILEELGQRSLRAAA